MIDIGETETKGVFKGHFGILRRFGGAFIQTVLKYFGEAGSRDYGCRRPARHGSMHIYGLGVKDTNFCGSF